MPITKLTVRNVGVFAQADFCFDKRVNVFVGPNNAGKTTALCVLAELTIMPFDFPPKHLHKNSRFSVRLGNAKRSTAVSGPLPVNFGEGGNWSGPKWKPLVAATKQLGFCTFIPALRLGTDFRSKGPVAPKRTRKDRPTYPDSESYANQLFGAIAASVIRDEAIIQDLIALDYQAYREGRPEVRKTIERIASICSRITEGFPVAFAGVSEDNVGLFPAFKTPDGKVPLNVLSQGTQGLLLWLMRFVIGYSRHYNFPKSFANKPALLIIDEIDAHLHPSWQRRIIPELLKEFPALQIFCSSHSPLMIAGLHRGQVQLLSRNESGKIVVSRNDNDIKGWSADEIYSCFLGIEHPTDLQTDNQLDRLGALRSKKKLSSNEQRELTRLRHDVSSTLLRSPRCDADVTDVAADLQGAAKGLLAELEPILKKSRR